MLLRFAFLSACLLATVSCQTGNITSPYAPKHVSCPSNVTWLRPPTGLNPKEAAWVAGRKPVVADALSAYLSRLHLKDFSVEHYIRRIKKNDHENVPVLSLALSGGGETATFTGLGIVQALDARFPDAVTQRTGGILQSLTYFAGLSGGSWPVVSFSVSNFPTTTELIAQWQPQINPFERGDNATAVQAYLTTIFKDIAAKAEAGFPVSLADYLARAVSSEVIPGPGYGINVTWSGVTSLSKFQNFTMPMPIIQNLVVSNNTPTYAGVHLPQANSTIVEATPFEWGTWQGDRIGFTPTKYLGTLLVGGKPKNATECTTGFDNAGFVLATASNGWNFWYLGGISNGVQGVFPKRSLVIDKARADYDHALKKRATEFPLATLEELASVFNSTFNLTLPGILPAPYLNPWLGINNDTTELLEMVDGSEGGQTIPLVGVMQPVRKPDLIIAYDSSLETDLSWENGTNLVDTGAFAIKEGIPFPKIPTAVTILNRNFSLRPTFFGCDSPDTPIVLYIANAPYSAYTNFSFATEALPPAQVHDVLLNSFNIVTQGNGTLAKDWPECLGCAVIQRSIERLGWATTEQCKKCFAKHCWDGVDDAQLNPGLSPFDPTMLLPPMQSFAAWNSTHQYSLD